jgi:hypothetical protein
MDPFVRQMSFLDGAPQPDPGVRVRVRAYNGLRMTVRFVTVHRPDVVAMTMTEGPWFLDRSAGSWRFEPRGDSTLVTFRYVFEARPRWLRWLLGPLFCRVFRRDVCARLRGLKRGAEEEGLLLRLAESRACCADDGEGIMRR